MTLLVLVFLGVSIAAYMGLRRHLAWAPAALGIGLLGAVVSAGWSVFARVGAPTQAELALDAEAAAGRALGEQLLAKVPEGEVLVLTYAPVAGEHWFTDSRLAGLRLAVTNTAIRLRLGGPNVAPQGQPDASFTVFPRETLSQNVATWLVQNREVKAIVSLMPYLPADFTTGGHPLFAFAVHEIRDWQASVRAGTTKAVIVSRRPGSERPAGGKKLDWQDQYELVTPETLPAYLTALAAAP